MAKIAPRINLLSERARRVRKEQRLFVQIKAASILALVVYAVAIAGVLGARLLVNRRVAQLESAIEREEALITKYERYEIWQVLLTYKLDLLTNFMTERKVTKRAVDATFDLFSESAILRSISFSEDESMIVVQGEIENVFALADFYERLEAFSQSEIMDQVTVKGLTRDTTGTYLLSGEFIVNTDILSES